MLFNSFDEAYVSMPVCCLHLEHDEIKEQCQKPIQNNWKRTIKCNERTNERKKKKSKQYNNYKDKEKRKNKINNIKLLFIKLYI